MICRFCKSTFKSRYKPQKYCGKSCYYKSKFIDKKPCSVKNCIYGEKAQAKGLCINHYIIARNHGTPTARVRRRRGLGSFNEGYKIIVINGRRVREHRHLIQLQIGRKLKANEIVHHINGNRSDNRINNLSIMTRNQHTSIHNKERWDDGGVDNFGR